LLEILDGAASASVRKRHEKQDSGHSGHALDSDLVLHWSSCRPLSIGLASRLVTRSTPRSRTCLSSVSLELIERALELEEDAHFSRIADERLARKEKRVSHARAWK
jgi:hypothetical protein